MAAIAIIAENIVTIKEEPDHTEERVDKCTETYKSYILKTEVKEEDNEEEELKPSVFVFLDPEEVCYGEVKQEHEDPLAMCSEHFDDISAWSVGGEHAEGTSNDLKTRTGRVFENSNGVFSKGNDLTHLNVGVKPTDSAAGDKNSKVHASHFLKPRNAGLVDGYSTPVKSLSESEREPRDMQQGEINECSRCKKIFKLKCHLERHMLIHNGERPYECPACQRSFAMRGGLVNHMRIHCGERPYKCTVCQNKFSQKGNLVKHMRIHSGERPYKCSGFCNLLVVYLHIGYC